MTATVHVGDALAVLRTLPDASVDAVITDPPYGIAFQSARPTEGPRFDAIVGDDKPAIGFLRDAVRVLRDGCAVFVFCEWRHSEVFRSAMEAEGLVIRSQVVWDRQSHGMGDLAAAFAPCHDLAWFATKGQGFAFNGKRPQSVLRFPRVAAGAMTHPAEKPLALMRHLVRCLCPVGGVVLDPYGGSGTTAVASVIEGRRAITCEIVPAYADLARRRIEAAEQGTDYRTPMQGGLFATKAGGA